MIPRRLAATTGLTLGATAIMFGVAAPPERCPAIGAEQTHTAAMISTDWIVDNQHDDGSFLYEYDRAAEAVSDDYNEVRHAGVMMALYQSAAAGHERALASADRGLAWAEQHFVVRDEWIGMTDSRSISLGTNALMVAALAERRELTGDTRHDDLMRGLAQLIADQTEPGGALLAYYDLGPDQPRPETYSIYYTGEAQWALSRMHNAFRDEGWDDPADRMLHYMATVRDDVEDIWPPLADHWSGYGLASTAAYPDRPTGQPLTDAELDMVRRQGGLIGQRVRSIAQRFGPWGVAVRGTFTPRGGGYGVFGEGLTGLWRAAQLDDRLAPERNTLAERAVCIAGLALDAQVGADDAAEHPDPTKVRGAWFIDDTTRMDDQQHALSALLMTIPILESVPEPASSGHPSPMWLLWFVVVIAVLNPVRVAFAARNRARTDRLRDIGVGVVGGGVVLVAVGALSGTLLDVFDTSRPAMRLGAAGLCMLSAAVDFWRPRPAVADQTRTGIAAAVEIAVPHVVRPALLLAGLSVVADHSLGFYALAVAVAGALSVAAAALPVRTTDDRIANWSIRIIAAAAFVLGAVLVAHAVFDL